MDKVEAPNSSTITAATKALNAASLPALTSDGLAFVAPQTIDKWPKPATAHQVIGAGAFLMYSMEEDCCSTIAALL